MTQHRDIDDSLKKDYWQIKRERENLRVREKGARMPENRLQFEHLAKQYEKTMLDMKEENSRLRHEVHNLKQKLASIKDHTARFT